MDITELTTFTKASVGATRITPSRVATNTITAAYSAVLIVLAELHAAVLKTTMNVLTCAYWDSIGSRQCGQNSTFGGINRLQVGHSANGDTAGLVKDESVPNCFLDSILN